MPLIGAISDANINCYVYRFATDAERDDSTTRTRVYCTVCGGFTISHMLRDAWELVPPDDRMLAGLAIYIRRTVDQGDTVSLAVRGWEEYAEAALAGRSLPGLIRTCLESLGRRARPAGPG